MILSSGGRAGGVSNRAEGASGRGRAGGDNRQSEGPSDRVRGENRQFDGPSDRIGRTCSWPERFWSGPRVKVAEVGRVR